jgi:hypothetical protein
MEIRKIRVNITVDKENLKKAKTKLKLFGGKLSTLFDAYLADFVKSIDREIGVPNQELLRRLALIEEKLAKMEAKK